MNIKRKISFGLFVKDKGKPNQTCTIRIKVWYDSIPRTFEIGIGQSIQDPDTWIKSQQLVSKKGIGKNGATYHEVNESISKARNAAEDVFRMFELERRIPSKQEFVNSFKLKIGKDGRNNTSTHFFSMYDRFLLAESRNNGWVDRTYQKYNTVKNQLKEYNKHLSLVVLSEGDLLGYVDWLHLTKGNLNTTIKKNLKCVKMFLKWCAKQGFYEGDLHLTFNPRLKGANFDTKEVIYLTDEEMRAIRSHQWTDKQQYLSRAADMLVFLCFSGLRYSDAAKLTRHDITNDAIVVMTQKTSKRVSIQLNKTTRAILAKYKDWHIDNDLALPMISNQRFNDYLKEIGRICGIDSMVKLVHFSGSERIEDVVPKHELMSSHIGRRTFVVNALRLGVPAEVVMKWTGHSSHEAMKPYIAIVDSLKRQEMDKFDLL